jgi:hypothetical protein
MVWHNTLAVRQMSGTSRGSCKTEKYVTAGGLPKPATPKIESW